MHIRHDKTYELIMFDSESLKFLWRKDAKNIFHRDTEDTEVDWWNWVRQGVLYLGMAGFFWLISCCSM